MPASVLRHRDYMDAVAFADEWMTPVAASFLTREERRLWFKTWTQMRFAATQKDIRVIRELTTYAVARAALHYSRGASLDALGFFQMYEMKVMASMTVTELDEFNNLLRVGATNSAHNVYTCAATRLSAAEYDAKRAV